MLGQRGYMDSWGSYDERSCVPHPIVVALVLVLVLVSVLSFVLFFVFCGVFVAVLQPAAVPRRQGKICVDWRSTF